MGVAAEQRFISSLGTAPTERSEPLEIGEAVQRVLVVHWRLVVSLVLLGLVAGLSVRFVEPRLYAASARVSLGAADPQDAATSQALADGARAIVTSRSHVAGALNAIGASRDPATVTQQHVGLQALGTSGVVELTVTDSDPHVAARLANALAADLVSTRSQIAHGASIASPADQLAALQARLDRVDAEIADVDRRLGSAAPGEVPALSARLSLLTAERTSLVQQQLGLEGQREQPGMVVDAARAPDQPEPSRLPLDAALGALLGLVVGVAAAAAIEALRPTVVGARAVARTLGAPVLGEATIGDGDWSVPQSQGWRRLALAVRSADVGALELVGSTSPAELEALAGDLRRHVAAWGRGGRTRVQILSASGGGMPAGNGQRSGVVLVAGDRMKLDELVAMAELVSLSGKPLLGVVTVGSGRTPAARNGGGGRSWAHRVREGLRR